MLKNILLLFFFMQLSNTVFCQDKLPAEYLQAQKLYDSRKFEAALPLFKKTVTLLTRADNAADSNLAACYEYIGFCYYETQRFNEALIHFKKSFTQYNALNNTQRLLPLLKTITTCYADARESNVVLGSVQFDSTNAEDEYFGVTKIELLTNDSAVVVINEGRRDGLYLGSEGNIVSSYAVESIPERKANEFLGKAKVIELGNYTARVVVHFYKKYKGVKVYPKDLVTLNAYTVVGAQKNIFYEMAKLNVLFLDNSRQEIASHKTILFNTDPSLENVLLKLYTREINEFYEDIKGYDTLANFTTPYKNGRFKGYSLIETFKITSLYDLNGYFNFVKSFPGKYMGTSWKINETYATWILNEAIQGENNKSWLLPLIEQTDMADMDLLIQKAGYYIQYDSLPGWSAKVTELQDKNLIDEAEQLCNKLIYIAKKLKDSRAENQFYYSRSFIQDVTGKKKQAIEDARRAYYSDKGSVNFMYGLASFYGKNDNYDSAFVLYEKLLKLLPGNSNVNGNYGWYKLLAGKVDDAIPLCRAAYNADPGSVAFSVNYAHCFLLKGNIDSAKFYYKVMLENLYAPADYNDGPKKDFEVFFTKGWQRKNAGEIADWLDAEFNEKYYAKTEGNLVWAAAKKLYEDGKYSQAVKSWEQYIRLFDKSKTMPYTSIHNAYNWIGLSYDNMKRYDSTIWYYESANKLALQYLVQLRNKYTTADNDLLVSNYDRLYKFYNDLHNEEKALEYKVLYEAEAQKVTELFTSPGLHYICLGGNGDEASGYQSNAKLMFDNIGKLRSNLDSSKSSYLLNGAQLTKEKLLSTLQLIRKKSKPEDIFIFYFSGNTITEKEESFIEFNSKDAVNGRLSLNELMNNIGLVYAQKKMIIMDKPNPFLLSAIASKYTGVSNSSAEVIFVCPGMVTPLQKNNCSLFTNELVNALTELEKSDQFSAKDFVTRASYTIGRGRHYMPVLSFSSGKDFLVFENKKNISETKVQQETNRGIILKTANSNTGNADATVATPQKNYALIFGINQYNEFPKLANPLFDAQAIETMLKEDFNFSTELIPNATLDEIENKLGEYLDKNFGPNDQLMVFFAGHGIYNEKTRMGYLVAKDSKANDPNKKTYLSYNELATIFLRNIKCKRIFLVLDACFAGSFFDQATVRGTPQEIGADKLVMLKNSASNKAFYKGISSGGKQYVEDGKPGQHSPFAYSFISTLSNSSLRKNFVTADEIIGGLKSNPPGTTAVCEGNFQYSDPQSHFIFERTLPEQVSTIKEKVLKQ